MRFHNIVHSTCRLRSKCLSGIPDYVKFISWTLRLYQNPVANLNLIKLNQPTSSQAHSLSLKIMTSYRVGPNKVSRLDKLFQPSYNAPCLRLL